jgi:hypothetical protein
VLIALTSLAYAEMRLLLTTFIWHFDLELDPSSDKWNDQECYILWEKPQLLVKLCPAKRTGKVAN